MLLSLSEDQTQILDFIDSLTRPSATVPMHDISFALTSDALDNELVEGGFLDVMAMEELGPVTAAGQGLGMAMATGVAQGSPQLVSGVAVQDVLKTTVLAPVRSSESPNQRTVYPGRTTSTS